MHGKNKMSSRELGLVLAQQILGVEDLHYGLWEADLELSLGNIALAQQHYTEMLLALMDELLADHPAPRILDVGCGTGHMLQLMIERGYAVDAVNPSAALNKLVRERLAALPQAAKPILSPCPVQAAGINMICCCSVRVSSTYPCLNCSRKAPRC